VTGYRIGARPTRRACHSLYTVNPSRGERRRMWSARIFHLTPSGKVRAAAFKARMLNMFEDARAGVVVSIADRASAAIVDRALRAAWCPVQGDA
jgi:hypothetical protein